MPSTRVTFDNDDGQALAGILERPENPHAYALFAHCFTCSKDVKAAVHIGRALVDAGIAVLRFDFTGLGQSEGEFADTAFSSNVADLVAAARFLEREHEAPQILIGHSLGGTAILQAAADIPSSSAVVTIASPSRPSHVRHMLKGAADELSEKGEAEVELGGRPFRIRQQFIDDLEQHPLPESIADLRKALLILHAPLDAVVDIENATELFVHAKHPKSFISLDDSDHLLSDETNARYAGRVLAAWASKYVEMGKPAEAPGDASEDDDGVVATTKAEGFRTELVAAGHAMLADEPESAGGTNTGPSPYDLLSAALASCTAMTIRMYAEHKKLDFESATVRVKHNRIHAKDCEDCESGDGKIDEFRRTVTLRGNFDEQQTKRLLEIADRCPVHRTLHGEVKVRTTLGES